MYTFDKMRGMSEDDSEVSDICRIVLAVGGLIYLDNSLGLSKLSPGALGSWSR